MQALHPLLRFTFPTLSVWLLLSPVGLPSARAEMDAATLQALEQTQQLLKDPAGREKLMTTDERARNADMKALSLTGGGANQQEIYEISAAIFQGIVRQTGGDPTAMQKLLTEASQNPTQFYSRLSAEDQARIKKLAEKINGSTAKGPGGAPKQRP